MPYFLVDIDNLKMNRLLFNYIKSIMKSKEIYIAEKPGFQLNNGNYRFVFHNEDNGEYETDAVKNAKFELADNIDNIESEFIKKVFIDDETLGMFILIDTASFMYTPLKNEGYNLDKIIVITGCETTEKKKLITDYFRVFKREDDELFSLDMKEKEIRKIIFSRKDEAVIFDDDVINKNRLSDNIKLLYDCFVKRKKYDKKTAECNCIIICNHIQTIELLEKYSDDILSINASDLSTLKQQFNAVNEIRHTIQNMLIRITKNPKSLKRFCDTSNYEISFISNTQKTLICVFHIIDTIYRLLEIDISSSLQQYIVWINNCIENSRLFFDKDYIADDFIKALSIEIENDRIIFSDGRTEISNKFPVAYVKEDLILFSINDFCEIEKIVPFGIIEGNSKNNGMIMRKILNDKGYLITNNGDKLLYKANTSNGTRKNYVALKKSALTEDAQKKIPAVSKNKMMVTGYIPPDNEDGIERIFLGTEMGTDKPVYWSIGNKMLSNKHMYIQADSGSGKTTTLFLIAQRLYQAGKKVVIFDFSEKTSYSRNDIIKMNDNLINSVGVSVFENGFSENNIIRLEEDIFITISLSPKEKMYYFDSAQLFDNDKVYVIRCKPSEAIIILKYVFKYLESNNNDQQNNTEIYAVLDEINSLNFDTKFSDENDQTVADVIFRLGRSVGLNLISATQFLAKKGSKNKSLLFSQSAVKIALHMSMASSTGVARTISNSKYTYYKEVLEKLTKGQAIIYSGIECADKEIRNDCPVQISISPLNK